MSKFWTLLIAVAISLCIGLSAQAADKKKADKPKASLQEIFNKMDKNSDGNLSLEEFIANKKDKDKAKAAFKKMDKNSDGTVSFEEFKAAHQKKGDKKPADKKATTEKKCEKGCGAK